MIVDAFAGFFSWLIHNGPVFVISLSVLVFVHEFGHFWVARRCGVKIEMFSIGFGGELIGWTDRLGTRWRIGWLPLGGFVKMYGDADASSRPDTEAAARMDAADRDVSFVHKKLWQKAAVVAAGPVTNFIFAITVTAILFATVGQPFTPAIIGKVLPGSAAEQAGLQPGDRVVSVGGTGISRFEELQRTILLNPGETLSLRVERGGQDISLTATPQAVEEHDILGHVEKIGRLGMMASADKVIRHEDPATALWQASRETWSIGTSMLQNIGQIVTGRRSTDDLSGPIGIGQILGQVQHEGFISLVQLLAMLSISLGLINLFPIPVLDGGHLLFYAIEALRRRPASDRTLAFGFRVGFALIVSFFVYVTWHDLARIIHHSSGT
jgi:regulator of sigma E protease